MSAPTGIPGEPDTIEDTAVVLERAAEALIAARDELTRHTRLLTGAWRGDAAAAATESLDRPGQPVGSVADRLRAAAPVLRVYAGELRAAQQQPTEAAVERAWVANQVAARQIDTGTTPVTGEATAAPPTGAGGVTGVLADIGNAVVSVGNAALNDPLAVAGILGGAALTAVSVAGFAGGIAADATGVGAVVGLPVGAASAAGVVTGVGLIGAGALDLTQHAITDSRVTPFQVNANNEDPGPGAPAAERLPRIGEPGDNKRVRVLPDDQAVRDAFDELAEGGTPLDPGTYPGKVVLTPDGTIVRLRETSGTGGTTIDATLPDGETDWKVHRER